MKLLDSGRLRSRRTDLTMVPLRDIVVFPYMVVPFFVGRQKSIKAVEAAMARERVVFLAAQKSTDVEDPGREDIYPVGTVAKILQMLKLPDGTIRVLVEGTQRARVVRYADTNGTYSVHVQSLKTSADVDSEISALMRTVVNGFTEIVGLTDKVSADVVSMVEKIEAPDRLVDTICAHAPFRTEQKIELLSLTDPGKRLELLATMLVSESKVMQIERQIHEKVKTKLEKSQKEYFLHEQMKEIQRELGSGEDDDASGIKELEERLKSKTLPEDVKARFDKEIKRLQRMQPMSPESAVLRTHLEWLCDLPWDESTTDSKDIDLARRILDEDHYDLKKVKERILDFIAVRQLKEHAKGPILCFVGPPGTGKTSLGKSVARALGRKFVRISLGGVRDEAEIRGHRKTYVGALPGKILQAMRKAGTVNPVFLLDEVDKMSSDYRGDPSSALLEVLDPEQNSTFVDHYLEVQYDLSHVMFITTANSAHRIPYALRDRMEVIEIQGYSEFEKVKIAQQFLIGKQMEENGLGWANITFQKSAILSLIRDYTMESGVRNLEREIANVLRKIGRAAVQKGLAERDEDTKYVVSVSQRGLEKYLGHPKYKDTADARQTKPGLAYGLAWTELGGSLLPIEVAILPGKGKLLLTGNMGDVMKESAQTALSFLRSHADILGVDADLHRNRDIHVHVPEGAIPKDGPSAGITITAALLSAVRGIPPAVGYAMTGEITLTGRVLPIGGIKEKVLAAHRHAMHHVLIPQLNARDTDELPREVLSAIEFVFVGTIMEALATLFPPGVQAA